MAAIKFEVSSQGHWCAVEDVGVECCIIGCSEGHVISDPCTVHTCLVEFHWCGFEQEVDRISHSVGSVRRIPSIGVEGLILTCCTKRSQVVVIVGVTRLVSGDDPNSGHSALVGDVRTNLEQFSSGGINDSCTDVVSGLVHLSCYAVDERIAVGGSGRKTTVPNFRRRRCGDHTIRSIVSGGSSVNEDVNQADIRVGVCVGKVSKTGTRGGDSGLSDGDIGVSCVNHWIYGVAVRNVCVFDGDGVASNRTSVRTDTSCR